MSQPCPGRGPTTVRARVEAITTGRYTSLEWLGAGLAAIDAGEETIRAWAHLDREAARTRAAAMDDIRRRGRPVGDLHGVAIGIKDNIDTAAMPTQRGCVVFEGHQPTANAALVDRLLEAGAVIAGKTVCTELAWMQPAQTRNPHNTSRTPGGSSSGSAAAVAAGHVPLAVGSQTGGSVIRPASFCGVYGFKPSSGIISRRGVYQTSPTLDQVGVFGADAGDVALLADVLGGFDAADPASYLAPRPRMLAGYLSSVPVEPTFAWIDMPYASHYDPDMADGCDELIEALGGRIDRIESPRSFAALIECHKVIYEYEIHRCLADEREHHLAQLGDVTRSGLERAAARTAAEYREALDVRRAAIEWFGQFFHDYDAIVTPSALGEAPAFEAGTGDPICCTVWTLCGLPCISLPLLVGASGMPMGVQLVGGANADDRLMRTTRWLLDHLKDDADPAGDDS